MKLLRQHDILSLFRKCKKKVVSKEKAKFSRLFSIFVVVDK